jgi:single-strand DNA-binding protein
MARSLNRAQLIGNLTRDPELRYTPNGTAVCSFGMATNRSWKTDAGEKHDEAEFHNIVAWNKLAELCSQFLVKGRKVYVEGRLATRTWTGQDGAQRNRTEIVISDMIILDSNRGTASATIASAERAEEAKSEGKANPPVDGKNETKKEVKTKKEETAASAKGSSEPTEEVVPDDIPF